MNKRQGKEKNGDRTHLWRGNKWPICVKHWWKDEKWGRNWGRERNLIYWKYYKLHLCITPQNYQPIKAECLLLSHYMEIRSHSECVSREGRRMSHREINRWGERNRSKCAIMQRGKAAAQSHIEMSEMLVSANISFSIREAVSTPGPPARCTQQEATYASSPTSEGRRRIQAFIRNINM